MDGNTDDIYAIADEVRAMREPTPLFPEDLPEEFEKIEAMIYSKEEELINLGSVLFHSIITNWKEDWAAPSVTLARFRVTLRRIKNYRQKNYLEVSKRHFKMYKRHCEI